MLAALIALHCTGAGMFFAGGFIAEKLGSGLGKAFGLPSKATPTWKIALVASVWELYLLGVGLDVLKEKFEKMNAQ